MGRRGWWLKALMVRNDTVFMVIGGERVLAYMVIE